MLFMAVILMVAQAGTAFAQTIKVAALGDSLTQGYGLPVEDGFTAQLQEWLTAQGIDAEVFNAGVSGDTTAGGLARVDWTLTPDIGAMIVTLGGNDLLRGIDPATSRANIKGILVAAQERAIPVLLIGMEAPGNYGADYKADFEAIYSDLAAEFETLYAENFLAPLSDLGDRSDVLKTYIQPDGIHPNAKGVAVIVESLGPKVAELVARARKMEHG